MTRHRGSILAITIAAAGVLLAEGPPQGERVLTGQGALGDWTTDAPGVRRKITVADLPAPFETKSVNNQPRVVKRPEGAMPKVPAGFEGEEVLGVVDNPRVIRAAPPVYGVLAPRQPGKS